VRILQNQLTFVLYFVLLKQFQWTPSYKTNNDEMLATETRNHYNARRKPIYLKFQRFHPHRPPTRLMYIYTHRQTDWHQLILNQSTTQDDLYYMLPLQHTRQSGRHNSNFTPISTCFASCSLLADRPNNINNNQIIKHSCTLTLLGSH